MLSTSLQNWAASVQGSLVAGQLIVKAAPEGAALHTGLRIVPYPTLRSTPWSVADKLLTDAHFAGWRIQLTDPSDGLFRAANV